MLRERGFIPKRAHAGQLAELLEDETYLARLVASAVNRAPELVQDRLSGEITAIAKNLREAAGGVRRYEDLPIHKQLWSSSRCSSSSSSRCSSSSRSRSRSSRRSRSQW